MVCLRFLQYSVHRLHPGLRSSGKADGGADDIDSQATLILQELWSFFDSPSHASRSKNRTDWSGNWQQTSEDLIRQVRILSRLVHVFVLRPDLIPLPPCSVYHALQELPVP